MSKVMLDKEIINLYMVEVLQLLWGLDTAINSLYKNSEELDLLSASFVKSEIEKLKEIKAQIREQVIKN